MPFGDLALKLSSLMRLIAFVAALRWNGGSRVAERIFRLAYHGMSLTLLLASGLLMTAILTHDFRFEYVIGYSSRDLPLVYLVSAFWGGQQGTYLLWALFGAAFGYPLLRRRSWEPALVMACYVPTIGFLLTLMLDPGGNPFRLAARIPPDGNGLNPLLQDPWMASHPPLVFLGYAAMTVPAVLALVALLRGSEQEWVVPGLRWSLAAFVLLGLGIVLGGFWAYKVLGWGGYWGWDPVENASLVPWIAVTALIHGILVQRGAGCLQRTNLILALAGYLLVLYATFLTRSGVLADFSVHSFPAGSIYRILLSILLGSLAVSIFALARRRAPAGREVPIHLGWPPLLSVLLALLAVSGGLVLIGTSWPIVSTWLGRPASFGPAFYNRASLPVYVAALALLGIAPFLSWAPQSWRSLQRRLLPSVLVAAAGTLAAIIAGARGSGMLVLLFVALLALTSNAVRLVRVGRFRPLSSGAPLAHVGFALMLVGIVASSGWGATQEALLPLNRPVQVLDRVLTYGGHVPGSEPQDRWRVVISEPGREEIYSDVTMFGYGRNGAVLHKPAIARSLLGDLYVAPQGIERGREANGRLELSRDRPLPFEGGTLTFTGFETSAMGTGGMSLRAMLQLRHGGEEETLVLPLALVDGQVETQAVASNLVSGASLSLERVAVEQGLVLVQVEGLQASAPEVLAVQVSTKPLIGAVWAGALLLVGGCGLAAVRRYREAPADSRERSASGRRPIDALPARLGASRGAMLPH